MHGCMHVQTGEGYRPLSGRVGIWVLVVAGSGRKHTETLKIWVNGWQIWRRIEGLAGEELEERKRFY